MCMLTVSLTFFWLMQYHGGVPCILARCQTSVSEKRVCQHGCLSIRMEKDLHETFYLKGHKDVKQSLLYAQHLCSHRWRSMLALIAVVAIIASALSIASTPARAAGSLPCDLYASGGTPCVAAHSSVRALFSAYNGNLYQVRRASDNTTLNIG